MMTAMNLRNAARLGAGVLALSLATAVQAQNNRGNRGTAVDPNAPLVERILPKGKTKQWSMTIDVYYPGLRIELPALDAFGVIRPGFAQPGRTTVTQTEWDRIVQESNKGVRFDTAAMVFPVPLTSASHYTQMGTFESRIKIDSSEMIVAPQFTEGYQSGERLARWDLRDVNAKRLNLHLEIPVTCWETLFNEEEALKIDWPTSDWPAVAKSALEPVFLVEWRDEEKEIAENKVLLDDLQKRWLNGRDPKTMKPVELAKLLAGSVMEFCDPGAGASVVGSSGAFQGLRTRTVGEVIRDKRCYKLDPPAFLGAVYRNAGLPARTVYGFDMAEEKGERGGNRSKISAWTEFAVMDPKGGSVVWIPVDVVNMRRSGNRMQRMDRPWKYFGSNEDLTYMIPISFHAHPPTGVVVRSYPAFWGWLCMPETPPYPHSLHIDAMSQSSREKERNAEEAKKRNRRP